MLTVEKIKSEIKSVHYIYGSDIEDSISTLTIAIIVMHNGYTFVGSSNVISSSYYDKDIGKKVAYDNAFEEIWKVLGYREKDKVFKENVGYKTRLVIEYNELANKYNKLVVFINESSLFKDLEEDSRKLLLEQKDAMERYLNILENRMKM